MKQNLEFRGNTKEYFKIWIVNIFLTIITLGIYSAWAKVRTNRYFYSNTFYKDDAFEYTADPKKILKGRIIVFVFYLIFIFTTQVWLNPIAVGVVFLLLFILVPWIVNKAIKFKLKNTKFRNINFKYHEGSKKFYIFFLIHALLNSITLFLSFPYTYNKFKELIANNASYGKHMFSYKAETKSIYIIFLKMLGWYFLFVGLLFGTLGLLTTVMGLLAKYGLVGMVSKAIFFILFYAILLLYISYYSALFESYTKNYIWSKTSLESVKFTSTLKELELAKIYFVNWIAMIVSLGLLTPWAKVRVTKYKCENFYIECPDESVFLADEVTDEEAFGDEAEDIFDIDIGI